MIDFISALSAFKAATAELLKTWQDGASGDVFSDTYPSYLPSFDEFARDVMGMEPVLRTPATSVGDHVQLTKTVERFPHFIAPAGWTGEVVDVTNGVISVRMYRYLGPGGEEWSNEVVFNAEGPGGHDDFDDHCRVLEG